jgi:hypothetical protein
MEIKKITNEMAELLRSPLPKEAISQHPTKTYLSSIKSIFVTERLNQVFGIGSWKDEITIIKEEKGMVIVNVRMTIPEYGIELCSFGGNDNGGENSKNFDLGDAYKGAVTDAITKIASWLEIGKDVYKSKKPDQKPQQLSNKMWLNEKTKEWDAAIKFLDEGGSIADIEKKYAISQVNKEKLMNRTRKTNNE